MGIVCVFTGNGKGKTSAAFGMAVRFLGYGKRVVVIQFLKGRETGELFLKKHLPSLDIVQFGSEEFVDLKRPSKEDIKQAKEALFYAKRLMARSYRPDLLIMDEVNVMAHWVRYLLLAATLPLLCMDVAALDKVNVFALGSVPPQTTPISFWLSSDPGFTVTLVPTRLYDVGAITYQSARRNLRIYFPRNDEGMREYDSILFSGGDVRFFTTQYIQMIISAVKSGVGAATDMGGMSGPLHPDWIASGIWEIFPNDVLAVRETWGYASYGASFNIKVNTQLDSNPLFPFVPLGIEEVVGCCTRIILPLEGATIYAWIEAKSYLGYSFASEPAAAAVWEFGEGKTNAFECYLGGPWWVGDQNEYGQDILINYLLDISGREYLKEIQIVHQYRQALSDFQQNYVYIIDLFDFVGQFGGNIDSLNRRLSSISLRIKDSASLYLEGDIEGAIDILKSSMSGLTDLEKDAIKMRDKSLLWVHMVEWLTVTATLMLAGYALDQLMLKRRLFKITSITRSSR